MHTSLSDDDSFRVSDDSDGFDSFEFISRSLQSIQVVLTGVCTTMDTVYLKARELDHIRVSVRPIRPAEEQEQKRTQEKLSHKLKLKHIFLVLR
jgi:hypothetical protein